MNTPVVPMDRTMDCVEALEILEAQAAGLWDGAAHWAEAARRHLSDCPHCQRELPRRKAWNDQLAAAIPAVAVPPDLHVRLRAGVPEPAPAVVAERDPRRLRRRFAIAAAALLLCTTLGLTYALWPSPPVALQALLATADAPLESLPPFAGPYQPQLPVDWEPFFDLDPRHVYGFPAPRQPQAARVGLVPFQFTVRRGVEPLQGRLLILRRWQLAEADLPRDWFLAAEVFYLPQRQGAWMAWREGDWVYVCVMTSPRAPADLHQLRRALATRQPLS